MQFIQAKTILYSVFSFFISQWMLFFCPSVLNYNSVPSPHPLHSSFPLHIILCLLLSFTNCSSKCSSSLSSVSVCSCLIPPLPQRGSTRLSLADRNPLMKKFHLLFLMCVCICVSVWMCVSERVGECSWVCVRPQVMWFLTAWIAVSVSFCWLLVELLLWSCLLMSEFWSLYHHITS